eukprot:TRINITY_DN63971_c0_g1_i1.p1 TRINITY_DN63971_c0_g1~~TRINITY_DN63971_c0_g1_i1.p1  ORF type:complete len:373 (-),score=81.83 TRINITY_DN63971_c0_g1_i1:28-1146(-)
MRIIQVGDFSCKVGENAQENWELVDQSKKHHWFFHLTDFPSPYVVLECDKQEPNVHIKEQCAEICLSLSKQRGNNKVKVDATPCGNVRVDKKDAVGECDYKNEGKVEVIVVTSAKKKDDRKATGEDEEDASKTAKCKGKGKRASEAKGYSASAPATSERVSIRKSPNGFATISLKTAAIRDAILREREEVVLQGGVSAKLLPQVDQKTQEQVPTDIFVSWGWKVEDKTPISEAMLIRVFDALAAVAEQAVERAAPARAGSEHVQVRKAAAGGCAVISVCNARSRDAILALGSEIEIESGIVVKLQPQRDPKTKEDVPTDIFAAWGRKVEAASPVSEAVLLERFEALYAQVAAAAATFAPADGGESSATPSAE